MAPSNDEIEQALLDATYQVYQAYPDETTVNKVRKQTEENLSLDDGFLASDDWKKKSKELIKQRVEKLMEGWTPEEKNDAGSDGEQEKSTGMKRSSPDAESPQPKSKRQKRAPKAKPAPKPKPKKAAKKEESDPESEPGESSELSELSDLSEEKPQKKRKQAAPKKAAPKHKPKKAVVSEDDDEDVAMDFDAGTPAEKDEEAKNGGSAGKKTTASAEAQDSDGGEEKSPAEESEDKPVVDEEEEYSDVIDEPPKPKRKKKEKKEGASKPAKAPKAAAKKSSISDDPNTEEIKKLQGYLVKCGVRKLWHNELKQYGDDAKAKIRHLKKMLSDVGMDGRFSESKAREIKERRELLAEVESAQAMSSLWGVEGRGRASRSKSKKIIESDASDAENNDGNNDDDDDDDDEDNSYAARRRRARADLAFLGDDDESD